MRLKLDSIAQQFAGALSRAVEDYVDVVVRAGAGARGTNPRRSGAVAARVARTTAGGYERRPSEAIAATVDKVLAFIRKHPGLRAEEIQKQLGGDAVVLKDALGRLRSSRRVNTRGIKRAMTYSVR